MGSPFPSGSAKSAGTVSSSRVARDVSIVSGGPLPILAGPGRPPFFSFAELCRAIAVAQPDSPTGSCSDSPLGGSPLTPNQAEPPFSRIKKIGKGTEKTAHSGGLFRLYAVYTRSFRLSGSMAVSSLIVFKTKWVLVAETPGRLLIVRWICSRLSEESVMILSRKSNSPVR